MFDRIFSANSFLKRYVSNSFNSNKKKPNREYDAVPHISNTGFNNKGSLNDFKISRSLLLKLKNYKLCVSADERQTYIHDLIKPIAYVYDPKATSKVESQGLISYQLIKVDNKTVVNGQSLQYFLPDNKVLYVPKGFKIIKLCGGGSGSYNVVICHLETSELFFMKYFHNFKSSKDGHCSEKQFKESVSQLLEQAGDFPLKRNLTFSNQVNMDSVDRLIKHYRMDMFQLGVVVGSSTFKNVDSESKQGLNRLATNLSFESLSDGSTDAESISIDPLNQSLKNIYRLEQSLPNELVHATFSLSKVAEGADDLSTLIDRADFSDLNYIIDVSFEYLQSMSNLQLSIFSKQVEKSRPTNQSTEYRDFIGKMCRRYKFICDKSDHPLRSILLTNAFDHLSLPHSMRSIGEMVDSNTFKYCGAYYPNPSVFLVQIYNKFPLLFRSKYDVANVHGDGQASNLMMDFEKGAIFQVDVRDASELVSPYLEATKFLIFGPEFTGAILSDQALVNYDDMGFSFSGSSSINLSNHRLFKQDMLDKLASNNTWQQFEQKVSPDFGLNIRLYGAIQAEADIGSFFDKMESDRDNLVLKRRMIADKVLALKLQKEFFDYACDESTFPACPTLSENRRNLKWFIESSLSLINS